MVVLLESVWIATNVLQGPESGAEGCHDSTIKVYSIFSVYLLTPPPPPPVARVPDCSLPVLLMKEPATATAAGGGERERGGLMYHLNTGDFINVK